MRTCEVEGCNEKHLAKGFCSFHYWQQHNKNQKRKDILKKKQKKYNKTEKGKIVNSRYNKSKKGKETKKSISARRRAIIKGVGAESFSVREVFEKRFFVCSICGLPINPALTYPDKHSVTLEHIIPISRGGTHSVDNCAPAHAICNIKKGAKDAPLNFEANSI